VCPDSSQETAVPGAVRLALAVVVAAYRVGDVVAPFTQSASRRAVLGDTAPRTRDEVAEAVEARQRLDRRCFVTIGAVEQGEPGGSKDGFHRAAECQLGCRDVQG